MDVILLFVFAFTIVIAFWLKRDKRLPPGPRTLPLLGYYPFLGAQPLKTIQNLSEKYGHIMRLNLLGEDLYFLNTFEAVNEALKTNGDLFTGRPSTGFNLFNEVHGTKGFQNLEGEEWKNQQKFFVRKLAGLGMGKSDFSIRIHELCDDLIGHIEQRKEVTDLMMLLSNFTSNVISSLLTSTKYAPDDPDYTGLTNHVNTFLGSGPGFFFYVFGPVAKFIFRLRTKHWNTFYKEKVVVFDMVFNRLKKRIQNHSDDNECLDVLDYCLRERNGPNARFFDDETLTINFYLMFVAGTDTTSSTLNFAFNLMAGNPKVQQKVYEEIIDVFGKEYKVSMNDIEKLDYTRAVLEEVQRFACVVPLALLHCNRKPVTICGYQLPHRAKTIPNIYKLSRDKRYFKNPDAFDPNHFLDENGKFAPNAANIPFGAGTRHCLGKKLAETEIVIGFTRLIQHFEWLPPPGERIKCEINDHLIRLLSPFTIIAKPRI